MRAIRGRIYKRERYGQDGSPLASNPYDRSEYNWTVVTVNTAGGPVFVPHLVTTIQSVIERGAAVALASDCNPGTCPTENLPLIGAMACTQMRMLPAEVVTALTLNAAAALGRADRLGSLEVGKQADLVICDVSNYRQLFYHFGVSHVWRVIKRGRVVFAAGTDAASGRTHAASG